MNNQEFYLQIAHALTGCQLVEQELKLYIAQAMALAKKCIGTRMPFKFSGDDFEESSLERLINTFGKLSTNVGLVSDLNKFKTERNFLSHQGILYCLDYENDLLATAVDEVQPRLSHIKEESNRLVNAIHQESNKFAGHLYFEKITDIR
jgi:hypothetical protein